MAISLAWLHAGPQYQPGMNAARNLNGFSRASNPGSGFAVAVAGIGVAVRVGMGEAEVEMALIAGEAVGFGFANCPGEQAGINKLIAKITVADLITISPLCDIKFPLLFMHKFDWFCLCPTLDYMTPYDLSYAA